MTILPLPPELLPLLWPRLSPLAERLAARCPDDWPAAEMLRAARAEEVLLWLALDDGGAPLALLGTAVLEQPSGARRLLVKFAAGAGHRLWARPAIAAFEAFARAAGCGAVVIEHPRDGWLRILPDYRAERRLTLTKEIL